MTPHEDVDLRLIKARFNEIKSGLVYPIVVEKNLKFIIDGHHRWYVFYELGLKVPAIFVDYSLVENSSWRLKALIEDLKTDRDGEVCIEYNGLRLLCEDDYYTFYWSLYEEIVKRGLDPL
ncbi:MAG: ParB N-terminal domain-containing protein, partial [Sulfolobus sp.]|nr:ParB N-terminal domain-containing protein [Sulfolobus sp.]